MKKVFEQLSSNVLEPSVLEGIARKTGAIVRKRKVGGKELLDMVLFDGDDSFNGMSMQLMRKHGLGFLRQI